MTEEGRVLATGCSHPEGLDINPLSPPDLKTKYSNEVGLSLGSLQCETLEVRRQTENALAVRLLCHLCDWKKIKPVSHLSELPDSVGLSTVIAWHGLKCAPNKEASHIKIDQQQFQIVKNQHLKVAKTQM